MSGAGLILGAWASGLRPEELPPDVMDATRWRVLDLIGVMLAGVPTRFGRAVLQGAAALESPGSAPVLGTALRLAPPLAAFVHGALSQALEFDDTHNRSVVHMSGPSVATGLALARTGRELLLAVALGNEVACRVGNLVPGAFHKRGFHPTGLFAPFGTAAAAARLLGLDAGRTASALGIVGSTAAGLLECWVDGTEAKFFHSGWAAQNGVLAARMAAGGATGPASVVEGRFGLLASHLPPGTGFDAAPLTAGLGTHWESRAASFKPYPIGHVLHTYVDAALRLRREHAIDPAAITAVTCRVPPYILPVVCEPLSEKRRPASDAQARVSLAWCLAEALVTGRLGRDALGDLGAPAIRALADRVAHVPDPAMPGPERFVGHVAITLADGRVVEAEEAHNRGSPEQPMTEAELLAKFHDNAGAVLPRAAADRLAEACRRLEAVEDLRALLVSTG